MVADLIPPEHLLVERIYRGTNTTERPGGQHAGSPPSDIRVIHVPSGLVAQCGAFRSDYKNRTVAIEMIEAALTGKYGSELV
jgi:protein subunit release factor A